MADGEAVSELRRLTAHHEESPGPELELVHCNEPVLINPASKYRIDLLQFLDVNEHVGEREKSLRERSLRKSKKSCSLGLTAESRA